MKKLSMKKGWKQPKCKNCGNTIKLPNPKFGRVLKYCSPRCRNTASHRRWANKHREKVRTYGRSRNTTGTEEETFFYGYKEPLRKSPTGFGYLGVLTYNKEKDKVQCHLCGKFFRAINNGHLGKVHETTAREYKDSMGLSPVTALIGEGTREKLLDRPQRDVVGRDRELKRAQRLKKRRVKISLELRNKRGNCPDQLLDLIQKLHDKRHKVPSVQDFVDEYGWGRFSSIRAVYGKWDNALKQLKMRPVHQTKKEKYSDANLLKYLRDFYKQHGRNASYSDEKRGLVPSLGIYWTRFNGIRNARKLAGLPESVW